MQQNNTNIDHINTATNAAGGNVENNDTDSIKDDWEDLIKIGQFQVPKAYLKFEIEKPNTFEEFNKKVFDLLEIAMDDSRLSQQSTSWHPWF